MQIRVFVPVRIYGLGKNGEFFDPGNLTNLPPSLPPTNHHGCRRRLSSDEKQSYIKAVQCLHELPPKTKQYFEAVHSRYDDFVILFFLSQFSLSLTCDLGRTTHERHKRWYPQRWRLSPLASPNSMDL
jgi:hypothetical protein